MLHVGRLRPAGQTPAVHDTCRAPTFQWQYRLPSADLGRPANARNANPAEAMGAKGVEQPARTA